MAELTIEQKKALALSRARQRAASEKAAKGVTTPDGRSTAPGTTEQQAASIPEGMIYDPERNMYVDAGGIASRMGKGQGAAASYLSGTPFIGEFIDEGMGKLAGMSGDNPELAQEVFRQSRQQFSESNPKTATALEVAGGVAGAIPMAVAAAPAVTAAAPSSLGLQAATGFAAGGVAGATEGAISGYGSGTNSEERKGNALNRGIIGGAFGGIAGGAGPAIAKGGKNLVNWMKSTEIGSIAKELGISTKAASVIRQALDGEDMAEGAARLNRLGDDAMLADAGPQSAQLLDTVMSEGGEALSIGRRAVDSRAATTTPALRKTLDVVLGEPRGVKSAAAGIAQGSQKARQAAYNAAYNTPRPMVGTKAKAIDDVLERISPDTMRAAVKEANEAMQEAGQRNMNILAEIADDGSVSFSQPLNIQQLDEIKKALGKVARDNVDQFGALNAVGVRANRLARDLKNAVADAVPVYGRAVKLGGDKIAEQDALSLGASVFKRNVTLEDVASAMKDASKAEKTAFKRGLRESIEATMSNVKGVMSDPDAGAREAAKIWSEMSSRATRDKIEAAIGKSAANRLWKMMERELPMLQTRSAVARGSQTAVRQAGRRSIDDALETGAVGSVARGEPINAVKSVTQMIMDTTAGADAARRAEVLGEVAKVLTNKRGAGAKKSLEIVNNAIKGQPISENQAKLIGRYLGGSSGLLVHQLGSKTLSP